MSIIVKDKLDNFITNQPNLQIEWLPKNYLYQDMLQLFGIEETLCNTIIEYIKREYYGCNYYMMPLTMEDNETDNVFYYRNLMKMFARLLLKERNILLKCSFDIEALKGLAISKDSTNNNSKSGTDKRSITSDDKTSIRTMNEVSPITSGANEDGNPNYTIDTPSARVNSDGTYIQNKNDGITYGSNVDDKYSETNPYYYEKYLQIMEKYNIINIVNNAFHKILEDYNKVW